MDNMTQETRETLNYFNTNIVRNHDYIMDLNAQWVDHLNFLMSLTGIMDDWKMELIEEEFRASICYDV